MQTFRTVSSRRPSSRQRQNRAIVNLRQLSQTPWVQSYQQSKGNEQNNEQKLQHTGESVQLPLNPKNNIDNSKRFFLSNLKQRPQTIQHHQLQTSNSKRYQIKPHPMTSINFYKDNTQQYRTLNTRSKLNQEIQMFASRIKQEGKLIQSYESGRSKSKGMKENNNDISFKSNVARKSFFYKQLKNYLYDSFKVDGKPVQIKWDRYSIDSHGLPKRKSIYSFKDQNTDNWTFQNRTDILLKKVQRYQFQEQKFDNSSKSSVRKKSNSLYDNSAINYAHQTLHVREKNSKNKPKGKLWLGRAPTSLIVEETDS